MPGFVLHFGAQVICSHLGQATPASVNPRVLVNGQPTVLLGTPYFVAGCTLPPPPAANGPCVTGQFLNGSVRVLSNGLPLLLISSQGLCAPSGTPIFPVMAQPRVIAT